MKRRRSRYTEPLPSSWLQRSESLEWVGETRSVQEIALSGRFPRPGTKAHLRALLLAAGWGVDSIEPKALEVARKRLTDLYPDVTAKDSVNTDRIITDMRGAGLPVDTVKHAPKTTSLWATTLWDSLSRHPWWTATAQGKQSLVLAAKLQDRVEQGSALFVSDIWSGLGGAPEARMPVFRRISLVVLMHPETLGHFMSTTGKNTDVLVVHGGFLGSESLYENFSYLNAVQSMFDGFLLYEAVVPDEENPAALVTAARRSGFPNVIGV